MSNPTPGQLCYEAWWIAFGDDPPLADAYHQLTPRAQQSWEAAAQAVLALQGAGTMLVHDLTAVLNRTSQEHASNTPDFILATYLLACLEAFNHAVTRREAWYGREAAAQAVLDHADFPPLDLRLEGDTRCPVCAAHDLASRPPGLTADGDIHRDMTCEDCAATWVNVYTWSAARYVQLRANQS